MVGKLGHFTILLVIVLALPSLRAEGNKRCTDFLNGKEGTLHATTAQGDLFFLGEGGVAKVFRLVAPSGRREIHKVYQSKDSLYSDLASLDFFRDVIATLGATDDLGVSRVLRVDEGALTVVFEDQLGETLHDVIMKDLGSEELRTAWKNRYLGVRDRINRHIVERYRGQLLLNHLLPGASPAFNMQSFTLRKGADYLSLVLKPDNVLVTTDGKLILFDPS